jgi:hypothetical protein
LVARLLVFLINVFAFSTLRYEPSNFGIVAGLLCGLVTFIGLFLWIKVRGGGDENLNLFDAPFLTMQKYPRAYWSTIGLSIVVASLVSLIINIQHSRAAQLFGGRCLAWG